MRQTIRWKNIATLLLQDALALSIATLSVMIVAEAALPWFLTSKIPFSAVLAAITVILTSLVVLGPVEEAGSEDEKKPSRRNTGWLLLGSVLLAAALLGSTLRYDILTALFLALTSAAIAWFFLSTDDDR